MPICVSVKKVLFFLGPGLLTKSVSYCRKPGRFVHYSFEREEEPPQST